MANINEILARAAALRDETALNSIDPERAGSIMYDTLIAMNELWLQQGAALVISKIYASVAAMNADTSPVSDLTGKPIRPGMVVVIASSDSDNGSVYRYNGTSAPRWSLVGKIGNITPEDSLTSDSTQLPLAAQQGKVLDGKISQLGQKKIENPFVHLFKKEYNWTTGYGLNKTGGVYPSASLSVTGFNSIEPDSDLIVFGISGEMATCLALYSSGTAGSFIEASDTAFARYTAAELAALGAKYFKVCVNTEAYSNGYHYIAHFNYQKFLAEFKNGSTSLRCPGFSFNGNSSVTIDTITMFTREGAAVTYYADGDSSSHSPKTFTLGSAESPSQFILVLNADGNILKRTNNSYVQSGDIVLLTMSSAGEFEGGVLYPFLVSEKERLDKTALQSDIDANNASIDDLDNKIGSVSLQEIDLTQYTQGNYTINASGKWAGGGSTTQMSILVPITPGQVYTVVGNSQNGSYVALLADDSYPAVVRGTANFCDGYNSRITLQGGEKYSFTAPADAKALYCLMIGARNVSYAPEYVYNGAGLSFTKQNKLVSGNNIKTINGQNILGPGNLDVGGAGVASESIPVSLDANGWEIPLLSGMQYALKKAEQALNIPWVAVAPYPQRGSATDNPAGNERSFPYSSVKEVRKFIGWDVSERTFMTAVRNPYSLFYTENVSLAYQKSGYGFTYNGINCATYYGMVCNILVGWAVGFTAPYDTAQFAYLAKNGILEMLSDQTSQGVHLCDIVWRTGHCILVTAVQHDEYGNVTNVQITEALGKGIRRVNYTAAEFDTYLADYSCIIYRYPRISDNKYTPSEFIGVRGESHPPAYVYNDDICFFAGDYAAWSASESCWLTYTKGSYSAIKIYKDNTLLQTVSISADPTVHKVDISTYVSGAGSYKACLTDGTNDSGFTYWQLVDASASLQSGMTLFGASNGTAWYGQLITANGSTYCYYEISDAERTAGEANIDWRAVLLEQYGSIPDGTLYVRVAFKSDYGTVMSQLVPITL